MLKPTRSTTEVLFLIATFFIGLAIGSCCISILYGYHAFGGHEDFHQQISGINTSGKISMLQKRVRQERWRKEGIARHRSPSVNTHSYHVNQPSRSARELSRHTVGGRQLWSPDRYRKEYHSLTKLIARNKINYLKNANRDRFGQHGLLGGGFSFPVYENIALKDSRAKPVAVQSSTSSGGLASRAIDGNTDGSWSRSSVTHTASESNPYWKLTFNNEYLIAAIVVFNRIDCCKYRLRGFIAEIKNANNHVVASITFSGSRDQDSYTWDNIFRKGKYVVIRLAKSGIISLAEVQVWTIRVPSLPSTPAPTPAPTTQSGQTITTETGQAGQANTGQANTGQGFTTKETRKQKAQREANKAFEAINKNVKTTTKVWIPIVIAGSVLLVCCVCGCLAGLIFYLYRKKMAQEASESSSEESGSS